MTRDEAKLVLKGPLVEHFGRNIPDDIADAWIDAWVKLGMLKLDEPKTFIQLLRESLRQQIPDNEHFDDVLEALDASGFKIVPKHAVVR